MWKDIVFKGMVSTWSRCLSPSLSKKENFNVVHTHNPALEKLRWDDLKGKDSTVSI